MSNRKLKCVSDVSEVEVTRMCFLNAQYKRLAQNVQIN